MALLLGGMDPDKIRIVGRWKSDAMFRYLHAHALPLIQENSRIMYHTAVIIHWSPVMIGRSNCPNIFPTRSHSPHTAVIIHWSPVMIGRSNCPNIFPTRSHSPDSS